MEVIINNITKIFGQKKALNNFSADLTPGIYGLLGPNGAGKTTLINILVGILNPDVGIIKVDGKDITKLGPKYLERIGYMPQNPQFYKNFKGKEFLLYMSAIKGLDKSKSEERSDELLKMVNLWDERNKKIGAYSGGMKQRLGIAQALLNDPDILVLDEPTAGLDPKERIRFRNIISKLSSSKIVLLATHIVSDIEYIAKEVILIKNGSVINQDKPSSLIKSIKDKVWTINVDEAHISKTLEHFNITNSAFDEDIYKLRIISDIKPQEDAININPNLEDVYMYYFREMVNSDNS